MIKLTPNEPKHMITSIKNVCMSLASTLPRFSQCLQGFTRKKVNHSVGLQENNKKGYVYILLIIYIHPIIFPLNVNLKGGGKWS